MTKTSADSTEPQLEEFFASAGKSLADAQNTLTGVTSSVLAMSEAELEVKATISTQSGGKLAVQTVSARDARGTGINAAVLSTLRLRYVALAPEIPATVVAPPVPPKRLPIDIIKEFRERAEIAKLERAVGNLKVDATFVPDLARWVVSAQDSAGRTVRETIVADTLPLKEPNP